MTGKPGMKGRGLGGARAGAGRPKGGTENDKGRQPGAEDKQLNPARIVPMAEKWNFAETALSHAYAMLAILVNLAHNAESEAVRMAAADKVLDRGMGKALQHFDIAAKRHVDIVYQSAEELREELRKALEGEGVPLALMNLTIDEELPHYPVRITFDRSLAFNVSVTPPSFCSRSAISSYATCAS